MNLKKIQKKLDKYFKENTDYLKWLAEVEKVEANKKEFLKTQERSFNEVL